MKLVGSLLVIVSIINSTLVLVISALLLCSGNDKPKQHDVARRRIVSVSVELLID